MLKTVKNLSNDRKFDYCFLNNNQCDVAVIKPNALLAKSVNAWRDRLCLNCFSEFEVNEKLKEDGNSCRNHNPVEFKIPGKFKTYLNKQTVEMEKVLKIY